MIVTYKEDGWEVVTQRAHGLLAAQLAFHWKVRDRPARWVETLLAIAEHDDGEIELDGENLITPTGGPLDYSMKKFDDSRCGRLARMTILKSRYIALLVSLHMEFLYRDEAKVNSKAREFLKQQKNIRQKLQSSLGVNDKEIKDIYCLLEWCDACSLLICQGKIPPENRGIEISTGPDSKTYEIRQLKDGVLSVSPWPFDQPSFDIHYETRCIRHLAFPDSAAYRSAFIGAPVKEMHWTMRKEPSRYKKRSKV